ncbi:putative ABC transporter permease [Oscillospiraceae bacterium OttesenSCG-928-F05]|nr:putative ABC transporter permease [Oscillospiraceae bacterium OttesenSCG-928-F05]
MKRVLTLWFALGCVYMVLEGIWRGGWVHIAMLPVGGLCALCVGMVNQIPRFYTMKIAWQALIGTVLTLVIEFAAGCVLNLWLGLGIWDYTGRPLNILGQVCPQYALLWFGLMPLAIWIEDRLRYRLWGEGEPYTLRSIYFDLVRGK